MEEKVNRKHVLEYIETNIQENREKTTNLENARYHHNTSYADAPIICRHGILSLRELNNRGIKAFSDKTLEIMNDTDSHINGIEGISLAVVGLNDLYRDEDEYNPFNCQYVDFLVSSEVEARRVTTHYGNEYVTNDSIITLDKLRSIDVRLLILLDKYKKEERSKDKLLKLIISDYNYLRDIAISMKQSSLDIPLREMAKEIDLDKDKISELPKLILK